MLAISVIGIAKDRLQMLVDSEKDQTEAALALDVEDLITLPMLVASVAAVVQHSKVMERCATLAIGIVKVHSPLRYPLDLPPEASNAPIAQSAVMNLADGTHRHGARGGLQALTQAQGHRGASLWRDLLSSEPRQQLSRTINGEPR